MIKLAAKAVDLVCWPFYAIAVVSETASSIRGVLDDRSYVRGYSAGYDAAERKYK